MALYTINHEAISIVNKRPTNEVAKICFILAFPCFNWEGLAETFDVE